MRILLLSFYYPPDLCAGSFRAGPLVDALLQVGAGDIHVDVVTTMPNRYHSLRADAPAFEQRGGLSIRRIPLPSHQSGMADQARSFVKYAHEVSRCTRGQSWDVVVATSSRLMTASLGAFVARRSGARLYLDIRDLFTDTMGDLLQGRVLRNLVPFFDRVETWSLRRAARINVVSEGFLPHIRRKVPDAEVSVFTNGIDDEFLNYDFSGRLAGGSWPNAPVILYAGNIGEGQGLHAVVPEAARRLQGAAKIRIIGDGGRKQRLLDALAAAEVNNVELLPPIPRVELLREYAAADILFLHLNDHAAFHKVLPSKIFEYAATGKPVLAGVAGHSAEFLRRNVDGSAVFDPCDVAGMVKAINQLKSGQPKFDRTGFSNEFARRSIMMRMAEDIRNVVGSY